MFKQLIKKSKILLVFLMATAWLFSDWTQFHSSAQEVTPIPNEETEVMPETLDEELTIDDILDPLAEPITLPQTSEESLLQETTEKGLPFDGEPIPGEETVTMPMPETLDEELTIDDILDPLAEPIVLLPESLPPPLKERKLEREIMLDQNALHFCRALNFNLDISNQDLSIAEFILEGERENLENENIEIGSLPNGIDMTFLNNADYSYVPTKDDSSFILQIINQKGSQKGNFNIPLIYTASNGTTNSTTICQINIINF